MASAPSLPPPGTSHWPSSRRRTSSTAAPRRTARKSAAPKPDKVLFDGDKRATGVRYHDGNVVREVMESAALMARLAGQGLQGVEGVDRDFAPERNQGVKCVGLEEKMGIHGNATCVMAYDGAKGWLVGTEHQGLKLMFVMMNEARLGVGVQGIAQGEAAYQAAAAYARDRLQGRAATAEANPSGPADPLIVHPDIRRMLMTMRAINEAGRALVLHSALKGDIAHRSSDAAEAAEADEWLSLVTPVIKGVLTDKGFDGASCGVNVAIGAQSASTSPDPLRHLRQPLVLEAALAHSVAEVE